jgi:hypothetical protein
VREREGRAPPQAFAKTPRRPGNAADSADPQRATPPSNIKSDIVQLQEQGHRTPSSIGVSTADRVVCLHRKIGQVPSSLAKFENFDRKAKLEALRKYRTALLQLQRLLLENFNRPQRPEWPLELFNDELIAFSHIESIGRSIGGQSTLTWTSSHAFSHSESI